jgi:hypothetical protein
MFTFSLDILNFIISGQSLTLVFSLFRCRYHIWRFEALMFTPENISRSKHHSKKYHIEKSSAFRSFRLCHMVHIMANDR